jgi:zinc finger CCHC domain-containing protein 9
MGFENKIIELINNFLHGLILNMTRYTKFKKRFNQSEISNNSFSKNPEGISNNKEISVSKASFNGGTKKHCLKCRKRGHNLLNCPQSNNSTSQENSFCYNCGDQSHSAKSCSKPFSNYAFAKCFICSSVGHLASACSKNDRGVYPNGGSCHFCGSVRHLARNCRPTQSSVNNNEIIISKNDNSSFGNPENDDVHQALYKIQEQHQNKKSKNLANSNAKKFTKVVNF